MTSRSLFRYRSASALTILIALPVAAQNIGGNEMRIGSSDQQPLEGFLGRVVPEMGHPK
jgi:hypothetical protein